MTGVVLWLDVGNDYCAIHFDTHDVFGSGNDYSHPDYAALQREEWGLLCDHSLDGNTVTLMRLDGKKIKIPSGKDDRIDAAFKEMATTLLKQLKADDAFSPLFSAAYTQVHLNCSQ